MPKGLKRYYGQRHLHFITCSCYRRLPLLRSIKCKNTFARILGEVRQRYDFALAGYERDGETGLDYAFARYYNDRLGRFMSSDPLGGYVGNPQSLNRYPYVVNNPMNIVDPSGMDGIVIAEPPSQPDPGVTPFIGVSEGVDLDSFDVSGCEHMGCISYVRRLCAQGVLVGCSSRPSKPTQPTKGGGTGGSGGSGGSGGGGPSTPGPLPDPCHGPCIPASSDIFHNSDACPACGDLWISTSQNVNVITAVEAAFWGVGASVAAAAPYLEGAYEGATYTMQQVGAAAENHVPGGMRTVNQVPDFIRGVRAGVGANYMTVPQTPGGYLGFAVGLTYNTLKGLW